MTSAPYYLDLIVLLSTFTFLCLSFVKPNYLAWLRPQAPLPPGPSGWPLIGNLFDVPKHQQWKTYHTWCRDLGTDIMCLNIAGTIYVIIDTLEAAVALLEQRSAIYSGRPRMPMIAELMGWDFSFVFMDYGTTIITLITSRDTETNDHVILGDRWRSHRRLMTEQFHTGAVKQFRPQLQKSSRRLLKRLLRDPNDIVASFKHMLGDNMLSIAYGFDIQASDDPYITDAQKANDSFFANAVAGKYHVDAFPWLKFVPEWIPGAGFRRVARENKKLTVAMVERPFADVIKTMESGNPVTPSFVSANIAKKSEGQINPSFRSAEQIKNVSAALYSAGLDTILSALSTCILGLLYNPKVVAKAQEELDRIIHPGHLPDYGDMDSLPYIKAIVKESLRWRAVTPLSVPRLLHAEDIYGGYRIPKGSVVMTNMWAILHDETKYPDPHTFNPDRFMTLNGEFDTSVPDPELICWGLGRRVCAGRHLAYDTLWIVLVSLLRAFNVRKMVDESGNVVEPRDMSGSGLVRSQEPFVCAITPRSEEMAVLIRSEES